MRSAQAERGVNCQRVVANAVLANLYEAFRVGGDSNYSTKHQPGVSVVRGGRCSHEDYITHPSAPGQSIPLATAEFIQPPTASGKILANRPFGSYAATSPEAIRWLQIQAEAAARAEARLLAKKEKYIGKQIKCLSKGHSAKKATAKLDKYTQLHAMNVAKQERFMDCLSALPHDPECPRVHPPPPPSARQEYGSPDDLIFVEVPDTDFEFVLEEDEGGCCCSRTHVCRDHQQHICHGREQMAGVNRIPIYERVHPYCEVGGGGRPQTKSWGEYLMDPLAGLNNQFFS